MDKGEIIGKVVAALTAELEGFARSARAAQAEATDEQSKAENKYDTRGLEASYLARGQSRQASETAAARQQFGALSPRAFAKGAAIDVGALVEVESGKERDLYFIGPCAGGTQIVHEGREILVLSPASPLGQELVGQKEGHRFRMGTRPGMLAVRKVT